MAYQHDNNGAGGGYAWLQCKCCPYGYHIDLDFVRYCETLGRQAATSTGSIKRRKDRRRQRQSMEVLLGLAPLSPAPASPHPPHALKPLHASSTALAEVGDELGEVVRDFERTLQRSKNKMCHNLPDVTAVADATVRRASMSSSSGSSMTILHSSAADGCCAPKDFDTLSIESSSTCALSPAALHHIREQMALSLERTRELEEMVKLVPSLQAQVVRLKKENRLLALQLRAEEEQKLNRLNSNYLFTHCNGHEVDYSRQPLPPPPPPPRRDFGVTAGVITRNVAVGNPPPAMRNASTATQSQQIAHVDRWYAEKHRFLNGIPSLPPGGGKLEKSTRDAHTQTASDTRSMGVQTVARSVVGGGQRDAGTQHAQAATVDSGVNAVVATSTHFVQASPDTSTTGVSDDTIADVPCVKCNACRASVAVNTSFGIAAGEQPAPVSLALLSTTRSKSFHLGEAKFGGGVRSRHVGVQYERAEVQTASTHTQYELLQLHKAVQVKTEPPPAPKVKIKTRTTSTDVAGLTPRTHNAATDTRQLVAVRHQSCSTTTPLRLDAGTQFTSPCGKCAKDAEKPLQAPSTPPTDSPSRIPRLQVPTSPLGTPVETRKYRRQDTYTKCTSTADKSDSSSQRLTALEIAPKSSVLPSDINLSGPLENAKAKLQLPPAATVATTHQHGEAEQRSEINAPSGASSSSAIPEHCLCETSSSTARAKCVPSREMQAAMKVLNDSLQKHTSLRSAHLKNANGVVEQEWFRVSSSNDADPLDVEDYLDAYEEVSAPLLEHVVNMVDASGNTAMHYAVSHGNFDVVSILLDSKVCDIDRPNKAGYTSVMLVSLAEVRTHTHADVVRRLFSLADVNVRAAQHGQTALMLAVSQGRLDMVRLLLAAGADVNIRDEDGSTALMCAAEHGHVDIVKHFLGQPDCDASIKDVDGSTALQIAMEAGHRHIGVLLYAHDRNAQQPAGGSIKKSKSASASPKMPSSPLMSRSVSRALPTSK